MLHGHYEEKEEKDVLEQCVPARHYIALVSFPTSERNRLTGSFPTNL